MSDEEIKAIEDLDTLANYCSLRAIDMKEENSELWAKFCVSIQKTINLIEKQQTEIETLKRDFEIVDHECSRLEQEDIKKDMIIGKLKKHNEELLRKLRNRVKEVKKLEKYSLYKKEFATLNRQIEKKDKLINILAEQLTTPVHNKEWVIDYYKKEIEKGKEE